MISKDSVVCQDSASFIKHVIAMCKVNKILEFLDFLLMKLIKSTPGPWLMRFFRSSKNLHEPNP